MLIVIVPYRKKKKACNITQVMGHAIIVLNKKK